MRAARSTAATSVSSRVDRLPPMSARWRDAATGFTPEKPGLPRSMSIFTAADVSSWARWMSSISVIGRSVRDFSLPSSVTAQPASMVNTWGSSRI